MHASPLMYWDSFFWATFGAHFGYTAVVGSFALVSGAVSMSTCKTEGVIGNQLEDFG